MGNLISVTQQKTKPQFILVLAPSEKEWVQADKVLLSSGSDYLPSYYLIEHSERLKDAGLLDNYSACLLVGAESMTYQDKLQIKQLASELPMILLKQCDKVYDFMLESLMSETILSSDVYNAAAKTKLKQCVCKSKSELYNILAEEPSVLKVGNGSALCHHIAEQTCATDFETLMNEVVGGLNVVAQFKGVDLVWQPRGESLPVDLDPADVKRALMGILLEVFQSFSNVALKISPSSFLSDHCVWLDISASQPKAKAAIQQKIDTSTALKSLRRAVNLNQGQLYVLDANETNLDLRIEWLTVEHCQTMT